MPFHLDEDSLFYGIFNNHAPNVTAWDAVNSSPWADVVNAMHIVNGEEPMVVSLTPNDGVYTITSLNA